MTDKLIKEYEISESENWDSESVYSGSEKSSENESMNTSYEEFIDNDESDESSDDEYIPPHKRQNLNVNENEYKVWIPNLTIIF